MSASPPHRRPTYEPRHVSWFSPGISLVEVLVAAALFATMVLGIVPLFTRATLLNLAGRTSTLAAHFARSRTEELSRLPFDSPTLAELARAGRSVEYLGRGSRSWTDEPPPKGALWVRSTRVRAFPASALEDGEISNEEALPVGAEVTSVHLWQLEVNVRPFEKEAPASAGRQAGLRLLKVR